MASKAQQKDMHYYFLIGALALVCIYILQIIFPEITTLLKLQKETLWSQPWRLVTAVFLHGSWAHLLSNLIGFTLFGLVLESVFGSKRAVKYALTTGVVANVIAGHFYTASLGASGLVFGVIGMLTVLRPFILVWAYGVPLPMLVAGIAWAVANIGGLFIESNTGYIAHLGGLACGLAIGFWFMRTHGEYKGFGQKKRKLLSDAEFSNWERRYMR